MEIIIVGCGKLGYALTEQLSRENNNITVIDSDAVLVSTISNKFDVMGIAGNGASYSTLMEADIEHAHLLIAVTGSDEMNLLCCVVAKKAGNCKTIARVKNPVYNQEMAFIRQELGISLIINPELAAANEIARLLRFPSAIDVSTFAKGRIELLKFKIPNGSILHNVMLRDIAAKLQCEILICIVERGDDVSIPSGGFTLQEGDFISFIATPSMANTFFKKINITTNHVRSAMIVGGGEIAYYLTKKLLPAGIQVKIIENNFKRCELLSELLPDASIIFGDGSDQNVLSEERIEKMDAFIALTGFDEENIMLSLFAMNQVRSKVVTKINRLSFDGVIKKLELDSVIYPKHITSEYILQYIRAKNNSMGSNVETLYKLSDGKVEALEFKIHADSPVINIPLLELDLRSNLLIGCIGRNGKIIVPRGQDVILPGDTVIVVTTNMGLQDINDILRQ